MGFPGGGGILISPDFTVPASGLPYVINLEQIDVQRGMSQGGKYQLREFSQINNMPGADADTPIQGTGDGCSLSLSSMSLCEAGEATIDEMINDAGLACPLSGPPARRR